MNEYDLRTFNEKGFKWSSALKLLWSNTNELLDTKPRADFESLLKVVQFGIANQAEAVTLRLIEECVLWIGRHVSVTDIYMSSWESRRIGTVSKDLDTNAHLGVQYEREIECAPPGCKTGYYIVTASCDFYFLDSVRQWVYREPFGVCYWAKLFGGLGGRKPVAHKNWVLKCGDLLAKMRGDGTFYIVDENGQPTGEIGSMMR